MVESNALCPGALLPATRELARTLQVSRFVVAQAYAALSAQGYTRSRQGSYTQIRARPRHVPPVEQAKPSKLPSIRLSKAAEALCGQRRNGAIGTQSAGGLIDFSSLQADPRLFPVDELRREFSHVLQKSHAELLNYAEPAGFHPLREYIASRLRRHGAELTAENVLITHGSLQGLALVLRLLVNSGEAVAIEQPTFSGVLGVLKLQGLRAIGIPMRCDGMDLSRLELSLERGVKRQRPSLVYTIPTFHNPTGTTTSQDHRERLLALSQRYTMPIIEDGFQEEFTFFDRVVQPIKSMDCSGLVFYLGTFSKVFVPGLRIGWIAARDSAIRALALLKCADDISCSPLVQAALYRYCASGAYEAHLRRMNRIFATRLRHAVTLLRAELPFAHVSFQAPSGGYLLWLRIERGVTNERRLLECLARYRVAAAPSSLFYTEPVGELGLRLSISGLDVDQIEQGVRRLAKALRSALQ
jgi:DNA-binding transcriptional MocR family regulator